MLCVRPLPAFSDNYIWLITRDGDSRAFVVDPGDAEVVETALAEERLELAGILITHHHLDHVGGLEALRAGRSPTVYGPRNRAIAGIDRTLAAGDKVDVLGAEFAVIEVPGHTLDHIAYFHGGDTPLLFCGDTLFAGGCGRLFEGSAQMMHNSLSALAALPTATLVYCAHEYTLANLRFAEAVEPENAVLAERVARTRALRDAGTPTVPSELALELATNPFLRCAQPELLQSLRRQGRLDGSEPEAVFATVRGWKDNF